MAKVTFILDIRICLSIPDNRSGIYLCGDLRFSRIHNTKEQIYFCERAENHKAKEWLFEHSNE